LINGLIKFQIPSKIVATIATIKKESESWKWTGLSVLFQIAVAWCITFIVYRLGSILL